MIVYLCAMLSPYKTAAFYTLGCKLNFSETSTIARQLEEAGYARTEFDNMADVYVINTCSVTDNADKKCRNIVRKAKRNNPEAKVIVIGCYAQLKPDEIVAINGVDLVLGANEKFNIKKHLDDTGHLGEPKAISGEIKQVKDFIPSYSRNDRTRTFLKVQDGCNYFCAFCTIPLARGRSRSATIAETMKQAREVAKKGAREVVLTGVNIGDFGTAQGETLFELIQQLDDLEGIERFRISSIEPNLLSDEIIAFVAKSKRFVPHFHIPLQSGSDSILKAMRRRYRTDLYRERVTKIKALMPNACIGVDVIVGFPGETDEEFEATYRFLQELDISYLHVFTYSERPNTTALRIDSVVPAEKRSERSKMLRILSAKKKRVFYNDQVASEEVVLFESTEEDGLMFGFTRNYVKVKHPFDRKMVDKLFTIKIGEIERDGMPKAILQTEIA